MKMVTPYTFSGRRLLVYVRIAVATILEFRVFKIGVSRKCKP